MRLLNKNKAKIGYFKYFFAFSVVVFFVSKSIAQENNPNLIDSLKEVQVGQQGVERIKSLSELSKFLADTDLNSAIAYDSIALEIAQEENDTSWYVKLLADLSYFHVRKFDYKNAKILLDKALVLGENGGLKRELFDVYTDLGNYFIEINIYDSALSYHHKSLRIGEDIGERFLAISFSNIGLIYYRIKNFRSSLEYHTKALNLNLLTGDSIAVFTNFVNIGLVYLSIDETELAKVNFESAIKIGEANDHTFLAHAYDGLGRVFVISGESASARIYLLKSISTGERKGDKRVVSYSYSQLAELELNNSSYHNAKFNIDKSLELYDEIGDKLIASHNYRLYSQLYEALGQFDSAYHYHKEHSQIESSIFNEQLNNNLANLQLLRQAEETQHIIAQKEQDITQKTKLSRLLAVVLVLSVLLIIVVTRNYVSSSRVNKKLSAYNARIERQNEDLGKKNKQLAEAQRTIEIQNERLRDVNSQLEEAVRIRTKQLERSNVQLGKAVKDLDDFIYKTSHDLRGPIATMQGIIKVGTMESKDEETLKYFETLQSISSRANRILNKLIEVHEMYQRSPTLEIINLERCVKAAIELAKKSELAKGIKVSYELEKEGEWVSDKTLLVTAIENMIVNAFLFSVSKQSFVNLKISNGVDNQLKLTFEDNGYGILETDVNKVFNVFFKGSPRRSGTGLEIYAARIAIEKLNGAIDLKKPKDNTIYEIVLPELAV